MTLNGVTLKNSETAQGLTFDSYVRFDSDNDGTEDSYYYIFSATEVPRTLTGAQIEVRPDGISQQTY